MVHGSFFVCLQLKELVEVIVKEFVNLRSLVNEVSSTVSGGVSSLVLVGMCWRRIWK